jgi:hypothetical protein
MADALVQHMPGDAGAELDPVVGLEDLDPERQQPRQHLVGELDGGVLVELGEMRSTRRRVPSSMAGTWSYFLALGVPGSGWMNFTSSWTRWPGSGCSSRGQRRSWRWWRWEAGSRFSPSRLRIRHPPEG